MHYTFLDLHREREPSLIIDEKTCMITNKLYIMCPRTTCDHMSDQQWTAVGMARKKKIINLGTKLKLQLKLYTD